MFGLSALFASPIWQLIMISDAISKYVILLGLFMLSIACLTITIYKINAFWSQKKEMRALLKRIRETNSMSEFALLGREFKNTIGGKLLSEALNKVKFLVESKAPNDVEGQKNVKFSERDIEYIELLLAQDIEYLIAEEENYLPFLGISAVVSPLLGLFGTIWGLINSFISISQEKTPDILTIAPGIAAALLTTLAGLIVAVPAMVAFHYFSNQLRRLEGQLHDLSDILLMAIRKNFLSL